MTKKKFVPSDELEQAFSVLGLTLEEAETLKAKDIERIYEDKRFEARDSRDAALYNNLYDAYQIIQNASRSSSKPHIPVRFAIGSLAALLALGGGYALIKKSKSNSTPVTIEQSTDEVLIPIEPENIDSLVPTKNEVQEEDKEEVESISQEQEEPIHTTYPEEYGDYTIYRQVPFDMYKDNFENVADSYGVSVGDIEMSNSEENIAQGYLYIPYYVQLENVALLKQPLQEGESLEEFMTRTETSYETLSHFNEDSIKDGKTSSDVLLVPDYQSLESIGQMGSTK